MIKIYLTDHDANSNHTFEFNSVQEVISAYGLTQQEIEDFLKGYKVNPDHSDFTLHLIYKD